MSDILNYITDFNYQNDYFTSTYNYYVHSQRSFPVTMYIIDQENTVWDDNTYDSSTGAAGIKMGSYEPGGVGNLSGVKFKKLMMVPIHSLEQITPTLENTDKGYTAFDSMVTSFVLPALYGIIPSADCVVDLSYALENNVDRTLFQMTNVSFGHFGQHMQFYRVDCRVAPFTTDDIEKQVKSIWTFYQPTKSLKPSSNALLLTKILTRTNNLSQNFKDLFDNRSCVYFDHIPI